MAIEPQKSKEEQQVVGSDREFFDTTDAQEAEKPEQVPPRDGEDEKYYEEHKGLPTKEERSEEEVAKEEAARIREREDVASDIKKHAAEQGTVSGMQAAPVSRKSDEVVAIEGVLQEDLEDYYASMSPSQQQEFKRVGEETAVEVAGLLGQAKVNVRKVLALILKWLKRIPGVNKYFLEQESKLKLDKLMKLKKDKEGEGTTM